MKPIVHGTRAAYARGQCRCADCKGANAAYSRQWIKKTQLQGAQMSPRIQATPNGYDPRWIRPINQVLADRGLTMRITDLDDEMWDRFLGPLIDFIAESEP